MMYGVYIDAKWDGWMIKFNTLTEAREAVRSWTDMPKSHIHSTDVTLVKIISTHRQGDTS